jgi:hypothetical protein
MIDPLHALRKKLSLRQTVILALLQDRGPLTRVDIGEVITEQIGYTVFRQSITNDLIALARSGMVLNPDRYPASITTRGSTLLSKLRTPPNYEEKTENGCSQCGTAEEEQG